jgi:NADH-quinone oxidoreductase subunit J
MTWLGGLPMAQLGVPAWLFAPGLWGLLVVVLGLWMVLSSTARPRRLLGYVVADVGLVILAISLPKLSMLSTAPQWIEQLVFWLFAGTAVGCAAAAITAHNPVYTAIWFAGCLLGVSGLFLFQHAQFLGVANIVVYAGAIVVTFLFVLMLANPEGHARYDRISWSSSVVPLALLSGFTLVAIVVRSYSAPSVSPVSVNRVLAEEHMVQLGTELFSKHLVAVEVAGTLLLVALVGAVAIVMQGRQRQLSGIEPTAPASSHGGTQP